MAGASAAYCIVSGEKNGTWILYGAGVAAALLFPGMIIRRKKRRRKENNKE